MLKVRVIPILTFNGFALVKTKNFSNFRMVGNPVQAARVYNNRGVDELIFLDILATKQNRKINLKLVGDIIKECYMPVGIGGGVKSIEDINDLLRIGADKVVVKNAVFQNPSFVKQATNYFGSQCISVSVDVIKIDDQYKIFNDLSKDINLESFVSIIQELGVGEIILNSVDRDGMMNGFEIDLINLTRKITTLPVVCVGGGGDLSHYQELFDKTDCEAVGSSSIFHFTQYTPLDIKNTVKNIGKPVRL